MPPLGMPIEVSGGPGSWAPRSPGDEAAPRLRAWLGDGRSEASLQALGDRLVGLREDVPVDVACDGDGRVAEATGLRTGDFYIVYDPDAFSDNRGVWKLTVQRSSQVAFCLTTNLTTKGAAGGGDPR